MGRVEEKEGGGLGRRGEGGECSQDGEDKDGEESWGEKMGRKRQMLVILYKKY